MTERTKVCCLRRDNGSEVLHIQRIISLRVLSLNVIVGLNMTRGPRFPKYSLHLVNLLGALEQHGILPTTETGKLDTENNRTERSITFCCPGSTRRAAWWRTLFPVAQCRPLLLKCRALNTSLRRRCERLNVTAELDPGYGRTGMQVPKRMPRVGI